MQSVLVAFKLQTPEFLMIISAVQLQVEAFVHLLPLNTDLQSEDPAVIYKTPAGHNNV